MSDAAALFIVSCRTCGQRMKVPATATGKTYKCVKCGAHVKVVAEQLTSPSKPGQPPPTTEQPQAESRPAEAAPAMQTGAPPTEPLGQILLQAEQITPEQLEEALHIQREGGRKLFEILLDKGYLTKPDLHAVLSRQPGVATIDLARVRVDDACLDLLPRQVAEEHLILPVDRLGKLLTVAMACPLDTVTIAKVEDLTGLKVKGLLSEYDAVEAAVARFYGQAESREQTYRFRLSDIDGYGQESDRDLEEELAELEHLPYDVQVAESVRDMCRSDRSTLNDVLLAMAGDPALCADALVTANHAAFGVPGQVDNLALAVILLGKAGVEALIKRARIRTTNQQAMRTHASCRERAPRIARTAAALAETLEHVSKGQAFTAGALYPIGGLALASVAGAEYEKLTDGQSELERLGAESASLGIHAATVSAQLATRWGIPDSLASAMGSVDDPERCGGDPQLAGVVSLAVRSIADSDRDAALGDDSAILKHLGLKQAQARDAIEGAQVGP